MDKRFLAFIGVILAVFIGFLIFNKDDSGTTNAQATNHVRGNENSKVTLMEYGDFQCPACGNYYPVIEQVFEEYKDKIKFQFRNLPLNQIHPNAFAASRAAEAANKQGKFWEMYNLLYQNQSAWSSSDKAKTIFEQYAGAMGLNVDQFRTDMASSETNAIINADIDAFKKTKSTMQTPTFFVNGKRLEKTQSSPEYFKQALDEALQEQGQN